MCVAAIAVSCFDDSPTTKASYYVEADFELREQVFQSDSVRVDNTEGVGFGYSDLFFFHKLDAMKKNLLGGFAVSRLKGSGSELGRNDLRVNSGAGSQGSPTYTVFKYDRDPAKMPQHALQFINAKYGTCSMVGCYINNTSEVVDSVKANFVNGDRLVLKATGYLNGAKTGEAELVLAEYNNQKDSIVVNWTPFKLQALGNIEYVDFEMTSTAANIPTSFCMDDFIAYVSLEY